MAQKGYRVFDQQTQKVFVSKDVIFYEDIFQYASPNDEQTHQITHNKPPEIVE